MMRNNCQEQDSPLFRGDWGGRDRRETITVNVGGVKMGSQWPVRVQSMTNTDTNDIERSAAQCQRIAEAGGEIGRASCRERV